MFLAWSGGLSGLAFGNTLLLVDDGVPLEMALGGFGAGLELLNLLFLESLQPVHLLLTSLMFLAFEYLAFICGLYIF